MQPQHTHKLLLMPFQLFLKHQSKLLIKSLRV